MDGQAMTKYLFSPCGKMQNHSSHDILGVEHRGNEGDPFLWSIVCLSLFDLRKRGVFTFLLPYTFSYVYKSL